MDFVDEVRTRSARFARRVEHLDTEEATKTSLVQPFMQMLGYDIFDPTEVVPEYTADVGTKRGEKVDYALMRDGKPIVLIEAKRYGVRLRDDEMSQLLRYFNVTEAGFAILTDGIEYRFFSDLEEPNKMDSRPFFVFNMLDFTEPQIRELKRFTKPEFDEGKNYGAARDLKYTNEIKRVMGEEFAEPSDDFRRFIVRRIHGPGHIPGSVRKTVYELVPTALAQFMTERVNDRLKTALERNEERETTPTGLELPPATERVWQPMSEFRPQAGTLPPMGLQFPDNTTSTSIQFWHQILVETVRWLVDNDLLDATHCPIQPGRGRAYRVATSPVHSDGREFRSPDRWGSFTLRNMATLQRY